MEISLVGKCGLYCGACSIFRAQRDNEKERILIAKDVNCTVDQVRCNGCGELTSECWCYGCKIIACLKTKNYDFCYQCKEFEEKTCDKYNNLEKTYLQAGEDIRANLLTIKTGNIKEWLKEQDRIYRCPNCNHCISVWDQECPNCSKQLK